MTAANGSVASALVAFQKEAPHISKDSINPHFKNKYASLDSIMDAVRPVLAKHGLAISQHPTAMETGMPGLRTVLLHTSGDRLEDVMPLAIDKPGPQAQGSALTYARRYAVLSVLGLVADEDDDANAAERAKPAAKPEAESQPEVEPEPGFQQPPSTVPATAPQRKAMFAISTKLLEAGLLSESQEATIKAAAEDEGTTKAAASKVIERLKQIESEAAAVA
jgi:ERF superfamily